MSIKEFGQYEFPKLGSKIEKRIFAKVNRNNALVKYFTKHGRTIYYHNAPVHWGKVFNFIPYFKVGNSKPIISSHVKAANFGTNEESSVALCILNSSLFYWYNWLLSNCRDLSKKDVGNMPISIGEMKNELVEVLKSLEHELMDDYKAHKKIYKRVSNGVNTEFDSFYPMYSKTIIDQIDTTFSEHYGFTDEELDFIINYDIKYRMGKNIS